MTACRVVAALLIAFVARSEQHRQHPAKSPPETPFPDFGLPHNATVLVQYVSNNPSREPPHVLEHVCQGLMNGRKCMNVSETEPIYIGEGCQGNECYMHIFPGPVSCMANATQLQLDVGNATRKFTCGLDPDDTAVIDPHTAQFGPPSSTAPRKLNDLPAGVDAFVWNVCTKGELQQVIRLVFDTIPAKNYTCKASPGCHSGELMAYGLCYTTDEAYWRVSSSRSASMISNLAVVGAWMFVAMLC